MPNLNPLIREIVSELTPDPRRVEQARERMKGLVDRIDRQADRFDVRAFRPHGSIERGTAIVGFADIDCLVVLDAKSAGIRDGDDPKNTIHELRRWIGRRHGGLVKRGHFEVRSQTHSVGVSYPRSRLRVDLVPALMSPGRGGDIFKIPSRSQKKWITSNIGRPEVLAREAPPKLIAAIRLIKGWRQARGRNKGFSLPSYAIELMLLMAEPPTHSTPPLAIVRPFFEAVANAHKMRPLALDERPTKATLHYAEPWTGENLLGRNKAAGRKRLIEKCRWTIEQLDAAAAAPTDKGALTILRNVFVPRIQPLP